MHELGLIIDVVEKVDRIAEEQNLKKIDKVVLQAVSYTHLTLPTTERV